MSDNLETTPRLWAFGALRDSLRGKPSTSPLGGPTLSRRSRKLSGGAPKRSTVRRETIAACPR